MKQKQPKIAVTELETQRQFTIFSFLWPVMASLIAVKSNVSRKPSNPGRRKRAPQGPRGIQAPDRREVWSAILHHKFGWQGCSSVSLRRVGADRAKAGGTVEFQPDQEKVSRADQLLRAGGGVGQPGTTAGSGPVARIRPDTGRRGCCRKPHLFIGAEQRTVREGNTRRPIHG